jgi:tripartite-type tricarboxylate transporter receptor subunit TctC
VSRRRIVLTSILAGAAALAAVPAWGQGAAFPSRTIRIVVGFAPGGAADAITRVVAQGLAKQLGQQVIVENKPGAEAVLSAQEVQRAAPDGHTILMGTNTALVAVPSLRPNPPYDPFKAFTPISSAGQFSMFLVVSRDLPARSVKELLDLVEKNPGKYNSASSNSAAELAMVQLLEGRKVVNARYKGDVPALTDMVGGNIHMIWTTGTSAPPFVKDGRVRALMTLQPQRSPLLPDVRTAAEVGLGALSIRPWAGFFGPAGMPPEIVAKLSQALQEVLKSAEVQQQLVAQGFEGYGMAPAQFAAFFREQHESFNRIVRDNGIKFE